MEINEDTLQDSTDYLACALVEAGPKALKQLATELWRQAIYLREHPDEPGEVKAGVSVDMQDAVLDYIATTELPPPHTSYNH